MLKIYKLVMLSFLIVLCSCNNSETRKTEDNHHTESNAKEELIEVMKIHLDAVSDKDLATLKSTLSPSGKMQLILPQTEITNTTEEFIEYHRSWFRDTTWTFKTKIIDTTIEGNMGLAITEIIYGEPDRDGKPYFNRMYVSYVLQKQEGKWYVIKDHASSIEKSTDLN